MTAKPQGSGCSQKKINKDIEMRKNNGIRYYDKSD